MGPGSREIMKALQPFSPTPSAVKRSYLSDYPRITAVPASTIAENCPHRNVQWRHSESSWFELNGWQKRVDLTASDRDFPPVSNPSSRNRHPLHLFGSSTARCASGTTPASSSVCCNRLGGFSSCTRSFANVFTKCGRWRHFLSRLLAILVGSGIMGSLHLRAAKGGSPGSDGFLQNRLFAEIQHSVILDYPTLAN